MQRHLTTYVPYALACAIMVGILWGHAQSAPASHPATALCAANTPQDSAAHWNALANYYLLQAGGNVALVDTAKRYYALAIKFAPEDPGLKLNLAIAYLMIDDTTRADSLFWEAYVQIGNDSQKLYNLLGLKNEDFDETRGKARNVTAEEIKQRIAKCDVKKKKPTKPAGKPKKHVKAAGKPRMVFPSEELKKILYWKNPKK